MTSLNQLDSSDPQQDKEAVDRHDRNYGWHKSCPREYTNLARNKEYQPSVPHSWLAACKDHHEAHQRLWDWHNRNQDPVLTLIRNESAPTLFSKA